ncbi:MAG: hypothetical protein DMG37_16935 [Acidobacteria bacterium]|nr:MAG: hypothetical protein DMG37_16935 [Acidobacteriota bacterium]
MKNRPILAHGRSQKSLQFFLSVKVFGDRSCKRPACQNVFVKAIFACEGLPMDRAAASVSNDAVNPHPPVLWVDSFHLLLIKI